MYSVSVNPRQFDVRNLQIRKQSRRIFSRLSCLVRHSLASQSLCQVSFAAIKLFVINDCIASNTPVPSFIRAAEQRFGTKESAARKPPAQLFFFSPTTFMKRKPFQFVFHRRSYGPRPNDRKLAPVIYYFVIIIYLLAPARSNGA